MKRCFWPSIRGKDSLPIQLFVRTGVQSKEKGFLKLFKKMRPSNTLLQIHTEEILCEALVFHNATTSQT